MEAYGIRGHILNWVKNFLGVRKQRVVLGNKMSELTMVTSGVTQSSVLGLILFVIYINDLTDLILNKTKLNADDG